MSKVIRISVVCLALAILVSIAAPMFCNIRTVNGSHYTRMTVNLIDKAILMHHSQHNKYPGKDIVQDLTGYRDDDGQPGYGYRLEPGGILYGPWNDTHHIKTQGDPPHFVDKYGNEIEYHLFEGMSDDMKDYINASGPGEEPAYYRRDYIVRSRGPNGKWDPPRNPDSDDVTNMWVE